MLATFQQAVEGVEKFLLRALLAGQELHIVNQQCIQHPVAALELIDGVVLQGAHHVGHELLGMLIDHPFVGAALAQHVADRMH